MKDQDLFPFIGRPNIGSDTMFPTSRPFASLHYVFFLDKHGFIDCSVWHQIRQDWGNCLKRRIRQHREKMYSKVQKKTSKKRRK